jgi:hypothetical protein
LIRRQSPFSRAFRAFVSLDYRPKNRAYTSFQYYRLYWRSFSLKALGILGQGQKVAKVDKSHI